MDKTAALASDILLGIGGEKNIQRLENCMTRVRVEVHNDEKLDLTRLKQLPGVSGYVKQGQQHQLIVGPGKAAQVVDAMRALMTGGETAPTFDDAERTKAQAKAKYKAPMSDALRQLANVFIPLIPAFIASGLITGIINILKRPDIVGNFATQYPNLLGILAIFGSAVFAIMNILVGVNTAKVFGGSLAMGGVMAGILSSPQLAQITLFGEALQPGRGGVIAVLLVVILMCWIEKKLRAVLPGSIELILNPLLTTLITGSVDCGGCNGCEIEIFATLSPLFDAERFGIKVVPSPRHADILLFTGAVTRAMRSPALRAWQSAPDPKICISYGACGNSGGIFHDLYCVWGGTDKIVPVDVYIPGCPPTPAATLYGFAMALGLLEQKIHAREPGELDNQPATLLHPDMVQPLRVKIDRTARRLAGYRYGRQIADDYLRLLGQGDHQVARWLEAENDPRLNEIVANLNSIVDEARIR